MVIRRSAWSFDATDTSAFDLGDAMDASSFGLGDATDAEAFGLGDATDAEAEAAWRRHRSRRPRHPLRRRASIVSPRPKAQAPVASPAQAFVASPRPKADASVAFEAEV